MDHKPPATFHTSKHDFSISIFTVNIYRIIPKWAIKYSQTINYNSNKSSQVNIYFSY